MATALPAGIGGTGAGGSTALPAAATASPSSALSSSSVIDPALAAALAAGSSGTSGGTAGTGGTGTGFDIGSFLTNMVTGTPGTGTLAGVAPYLAAGAIGMDQAKSANNANQALVAPLMQSGQAMNSAAQTLLTNAMGQKLDPLTGQVVSTSNAFGQGLIDASSPLNGIAQQAFADYSAGKLPAADQLALDQKVASQKQQVASQLASQGITDSSLINAQMQQIDNQAAVTKQQLLDSRFQTGSQAFSQYLTGTQAGQQTILAGQQYAVTQLNTMMTQAFGAAALGANEMTSAIDMAIQSNTALGQQVGQLMQNLMMSYAIASYNGKQGAAATGGGAPAAGGSAPKVSLGGGGGGGGSAPTISGNFGKAVGSLGGALGTPSLGGAYDPTTGSFTSTPPAGFGGSVGGTGSPWSSIGQDVGAGTGLTPNVTPTLPTGTSVLDQLNSQDFSQSSPQTTGQYSAYAGYY